MGRSGGVYLYRHFDAEGRLLYVGITVDPVARLRNHKLNAPWARDIARVEVSVAFGSREEAEDAERRVIRAEAPTYNTVHTADVLKEERAARVKAHAAALGYPIRAREMRRASGNEGRCSEVIADIDYWHRHVSGAGLARLLPGRLP